MSGDKIEVNADPAHTPTAIPVANAAYVIDEATFEERSCIIPASLRHGEGP